MLKDIITNPADYHHALLPVKTKPNFRPGDTVYYCALTTSLFNDSDIHTFIEQAQLVQNVIFVPIDETHFSKTIVHALKEVQSLTTLRFVATTKPLKANIWYVRMISHHAYGFSGLLERLLSYVTMTDYSVVGGFTMPFNMVEQPAGRSYPRQLIALNAQYEPLSVGSLGYQSLIHENGHAVGFKHPQFQQAADMPPYLPDEAAHLSVLHRIEPDDAWGTLTANTQVVSYGFMPADIKALQQLYGRGQGNRQDFEVSGTPYLLETTINGWIYRQLFRTLPPNQYANNTLTIVDPVNCHLIVPSSDFVPNHVGHTQLFIPSDLHFSRITLNSGHDKVEVGPVPSGQLEIHTGMGQDTILLMPSFFTEGARQLTIHFGHPQTSMLVIPDAPASLKFESIYPAVCALQPSTMIRHGNATLIVCHMTPTQLQQHYGILPLSYTQILYSALLDIHHQPILFGLTPIKLGLTVLAGIVGFFKKEIEAHIHNVVKKYTPSYLAPSLETAVLRMSAEIAVLHNTPNAVIMNYSFAQVIRSTCNWLTFYRQNIRAQQEHDLRFQQSAQTSSAAAPSVQSRYHQDLWLPILGLLSFFLPSILFGRHSILLTQLMMGLMFGFLSSIIQSYDSYRATPASHRPRLSEITTRSLWKGIQDSVLDTVRAFPGGDITLNQLGYVTPENPHRLMRASF